MTEQRDLLESLTEAGLIRPEAVRAALTDERLARMPLEQALVEGQLIDEVTLATALARLHGLPFQRLHEAEVRPEVLTLIPEEMALNFCVVPVEADEERILLAVADPLDVTAEDMVRLHTGRKVDRVVAPRSDILATLHGKVGDMSKALGRYATTSTSGILELTEEEEARDVKAVEGYREHDAPIIQLVNALVTEAISLQASDIHVEPGDQSLRVRYRIDGVLRTMAELPRSLQNAVASRLKLASGMDISEKRRPQDGRSRVRIGARWVDLRVSSLPTFHGEKVVLRILDKEVGVLNLEGLGMLEDHYRLYHQLAESPQGMILITGPTGSGKTTTLYATLNVRNRITDNLVTVEDPIEFQLNGVAQVQTNPKAGVTFASALRAILRQDPDIIMVGEIRDLETGEIAFQAAQTGHFVLSTLHTNSSSATLTRLAHMGIVPYLMASSLLGVVAQRLVRRLCEACRVETRPDPTTLDMLRMATARPLPARVFVERGCEACSQTGYRGRVGVYEVLPMTARLRHLVFRQASQRQIARAANREGVRSLLEDGLEKVERGWTSLEELLRAVNLEPETLRPGGLPGPAPAPPGQTASRAR